MIVPFLEQNPILLLRALEFLGNVGLSARQVHPPVAAVQQVLHGMFADL